MNNEMTFEEINNLISVQELEEMDLILAREGAMDTSAACRFYKKVKPIIVLISKIPFLSPKVKKAIEILIKILDGLCPE